MGLLSVLDLVSLVLGSLWSTGCVNGSSFSTDLGLFFFCEVGSSMSSCFLKTSLPDNDRFF